MNISRPSFDALIASLQGIAIARGEPGFRAEVVGYNTATTFDPEFVIGAASEADVQTAVRFAAHGNKTVSVQATGHGSYAPIRDGVLITTSRMTDIDLDPDTATVTLGAGVRWSDLTPLLTAHGLAAVTGSAPTVGAIGLALGGGLGPLSRSLGCTVDYVESFRVVDAEGEAQNIDSESDPELFWALRGGKVGLGIVTEMRLRLVRLPQIYAGSFFWAGEHIEDTLRLWTDWTHQVPDSVNSSVNIIRFPDADGPPPKLRGRTVIHLRFTYVNQEATAEQLVEQGESALAPFRALPAPLIDTVGLLPGNMTGTIHGDPEGPLLVWEHGVFLSDLTQDAVTELLEIVGDGRDAPFIAVETRHFGGAIARRQHDSAMGGRGAEYGFFLIGAPDPELFAQTLPDLAAHITEALEPLRHPITNYHWSGHPTGDAFARLWSPEQHRRLDAVRTRVDPKGRFVFAQPQPSPTSIQQAAQPSPASGHHTQEQS